jgi:hypothetical protein
MYISVCKNVIASNNKKSWIDPEPTIRVSKTPSGKVTNRVHSVGIVDSRGNVVAKMIATQDGKPVIKCGAKVALITEYDIVELDDE